MRSTLFRECVTSRRENARTAGGGALEHIRDAMRSQRKEVNFVMDNAIQDRGSLRKVGNLEAHVMHHYAACVVVRSTRTSKRVVVDDSQTWRPGDTLSATESRSFVCD